MKLNQEKDKKLTGKSKKILWAPWRSEYILNIEHEKSCIFCSKPEQNDDEKNLIIYRGKLCFAMLNLYPYNNGHLMAVPFRHTGKFEDLRIEELSELMDILKRCIQKLSTLYTPHGFNIGMNLGRVAGAGVEDHVHFHIVPRWNGDTNFMPVISETKVISLSLRETYSLLKGL